MKSWQKTGLLVLLCLTILLPQAGGVLAQQTATTPPILLIVNSAAPNKLGPYLAEILRTEGLNAFDQIALGSLTAAQLAQYDLAILVQTQLTSAQASMLTSYVSGGGALLAMRPDAQIAPIFGLSGASGTLSDGYLKLLNGATFNGATPGGGLTSATLQIHGDADRTVSIAIHARAFVREVDGARLIELAGVGHMVQNAAPEIVIAAIKSVMPAAGLAPRVAASH